MSHSRRAPSDPIAGGYILLARKLLGSTIMSAPPNYTKLFLHILLSANYADAGTIKRGELLTSYADLIDAMSYRIGVRVSRPTEKEIRGALDMMKSEGMISSRRTPYGMVLTVTNYDTYQSPSNYATKGATKGGTAKPKTAEETDGYADDDSTKGAMKGGTLTKGATKGGTKGGTETENSADETDTCEPNEGTKGGMKGGTKGGTKIKEERRRKEEEEKKEEVTPPYPPLAGKTKWAAFSKFWDAYPKHRRTNREAAGREWNRLTITDESLAQILSALETQKLTEDWNKHDGKYVPAAHSYLRDKRWQDVEDTATVPATDFDPYLALLMAR